MTAASIGLANRFRRTPQLTIETRTARERAEANFKKKEPQLEDGQKARAEYEATALAVREKTAKLRALRLAHEARQGEQNSPQSVPLPARRKGRRQGLTTAAVG